MEEADAAAGGRSNGADEPVLSFTYVQGMNVLAAPFLYTLPSEIEAFFCFSQFIENSCPLYVQQTLEGVHRGLKVGFLVSSHSNSQFLSLIALGPLLENRRCRTI